MKKLLLTLPTFLFSSICFSQSLPSDSTILLTIFGTVNEGGKSTTVLKPEELLGEFSEDSLLSYGVTFKENIFFDNQEITFVIIQAEDSMLHGHIFGFTNTYYIKKNNSKFDIIYKLEAKEPEPIGDNPEPNIIKIGKSKSALVTTFQSSGNRHVQRDLSFSLIMFKGIVHLLNVNMDYSNEAWINVDEIAQNDACPINSKHSTFKIIETDNEWYDIQIITTKDTFG